MFKNIFSKSSKEKKEPDEYQLICDIIKSLHPKTTISRDTRFDSLGFNSMMYIEFIIKLEDATKIDLEQLAGKIDFLALETIDDMARALRSIKMQS